MGSVTAILFNVPGSAPSAATLIDGHPLAQQGRGADRARLRGHGLGAGLDDRHRRADRPRCRSCAALILAFGPLEFLLLACGA